MKPPDELISLAHALGDPANDLCILSEGNVSCDCGDGTFWIKASGCCLQSASAEDFVRVASSPILGALDGEAVSREQERELLNNACVERADNRVPSTESFFHAALLSAKDIRYVAHSHPTPVIAISMTEYAEEFCSGRIFPDEAVFCGARSCWVPYTDPGLELARAIVTSKQSFEQKFGDSPNVFVLQNHGLIATGPTAKAAEAATLMAAKAAKAMILGLCAGRGRVGLLDEMEIAAILDWPDERYRRDRMTRP